MASGFFFVGMAYFAFALIVVEPSQWFAIQLWMTLDTVEIETISRRSQVLGGLFHEFFD